MLLLIPLDATKVLNFTYGVVLLLIPLDATKVLNYLRCCAISLPYEGIELYLRCCAMLRRY